MNRRTLLAALTTHSLVWNGVGCSTAHASGQQRPYPSRPVSLILPFAAGNASDVMARLVTQKLSGYLGQSVVVENRPGAGGVGAIKQAASAAPDGYTLLLLGAAATISQRLFKPQPYDLLKQFSPVSGLSEAGLLLLVGKNSPLNTIADFIREARAKSDALMVGVSLLGTTQHLSAELFKLNERLNFTIVPFSKSSEVMVAVNNGDVHAAFDLVPAVVGPINSGQLKPLVIGDSKRSPLLLNVPTMTEAGVKDFKVTSWGMVVAPAGTPEPIVQQLNEGIQRALREPDIVSRFNSLGVSALPGTPTQTRHLLASELNRWASVIQQAKVVLR